MLLSMTGYGEAQQQDEGLRIRVQVRTLNSRYFKVNLRGPDGFGALEPQIEAAVRQHVKRGTVQVNLRVDRARGPEDYQLDLTVLQGYHRQLEKLSRQLHEMEEISVSSLLSLPGVVVEKIEDCPDLGQTWPVVKQALDEAFTQLQQMRIDEGRAMATDMKNNCDEILGQLGQVESRAPVVAENYRAKLTERVRNAMTDLETHLEAGDLVREVAIFAERSDISEEVVRMRSHVEQFAGALAAKDSSGRKLEFVTQEMFREANTIGSKANDVEISRRVIDIKAAIERIREMVQNVE